MSESEPVTGKKRDIVIALDKGILWFTRHWILVITILVGIYAFLPFGAPIAMQAGAPGVGNTIYNLYSPLCHQFTFRSCV